ncbi:MAG: hypothetical protein NVS3B26_06890 [Mycobacteriales bacterium]
MLASGLASGDPSELGAHILAAWDDFLLCVRGADLDRRSRLPGWRGRDVAIHLGSWPGRDVVGTLLASATAGGTEPHDADATNARLIAEHPEATPADVVEALVAARDDVAGYFASSSATEVGTMPAGSPLGPLPVTTLLHAACYELAVHALDLAPCGAPPPSAALLDRGLAALIDVTGALACRSGVDITLTAQTPGGGWGFRSDPTGWETRAVPPGRFEGTGVRGSVVDLLDTSAGRVHLGQLLLSRRLQVQQLPSFMRLAPLLHEVPGLPGGAALRTAVTGLGSVTRVLGRFRR